MTASDMPNHTPAKPRVAVIGGANLDISAHAEVALIPSDSNRGTIRESMGGVGRNIAHNLALLGTEVMLFTAVGDDLPGETLREGCRSAGISTDGMSVLPGHRTSSYLYIADKDGEMQLAVNDMRICDEITPALLSVHEEAIRSAALLVADTNLPEETLRWLSGDGFPPLYVDPVSVVKGRKLIPLLPRIHALKPNRAEAKMLTGTAVENREAGERAAEELVRMGVQNVYLSMGEDGLVVACPEETCFLPCPPLSIRSTTGCGDAFLAGLVWGILTGFSREKAALAGICAAAVTAEREDTVNPLLSEALLRERLAMLTHESC